MHDLISRTAWVPSRAMGEAGKLFKIDMEIANIRERLQISPENKTLKTLLDEFLKKREKQVNAIQRKLRSSERAS